MYCLNLFESTLIEVDFQSLSGILMSITEIGCELLVLQYKTDGLTQFRTSSQSFVNKLVGIGIEAHNDPKVMVGTRIGAAIEVINNECE